MQLKKKEVKLILVDTYVLWSASTKALSLLSPVVGLGLKTIQKCVAHAPWQHEGKTCANSSSWLVGVVTAVGL